MIIHAVIRRQLPLLLYGELGRWKAEVLKRHLSRCQSCHMEYEELKGLRRLLVEADGDTPPESVLEELRGQLRTELEARPPTIRSGQRLDLGEAISGLVIRPRRVLAGAVQALAGAAAGFILAALFWPSGADERPPFEALASEQIRIENVRFLGDDSEGRKVELSLAAIRPVQVRGSVDDPYIQRLLARAILSDRNAGVRLRAVSVLRTPAPEAVDPEIHRALLTAMMADDNAGVRMAALEVVRQQPADRESRDALLHVLLYDPNPGLRIAAINALELLMANFSGEEDAALRDHFGELQSDDNAYIRWKAKTVLFERGPL